MRYVHISVIYWYRYCDYDKKISDDFINSCPKDFFEFDYMELKSTDTFNPFLVGYNDKLGYCVELGKGTSQVVWSVVKIDEIDRFKEFAINMYNALVDNGVEILYTHFIISSDKKVEKGIEILKPMLSNKIDTENLTEINVAFCDVIDEQLTQKIKIINTSNVKLMQVMDQAGREFPVNMMSLQSGILVSEGIIVDYELSDRYSFDNVPNYRTSPFIVNKMLYNLMDYYNDCLNKYIDISD